MSSVKRMQVAGTAQYLRCVQRTSRVSVVRESEDSALVTFWHDAILPLLAATMDRENVAIYIRTHPFIDDTLDLLNYLGMRTFVADNRGTAVVKAARRWLSVPGRLLAVTLDAGQPQVASPGVVRLARALGVPVCPLSVSASHGYRMPRWDRTVVPHLGGELSVRVLPAVAGPTVAATTEMVQRTLLASTLAAAAPARVRWRAAWEVWPRLCLMPRTRGRLKVWPATEAVPFIF